ncbi:hypothetical protein GC197_04430 [bacterium]|nr:hypothetical protein [bacterium]
MQIHNCLICLALFCLIGAESVAYGQAAQPASKKDVLINLDKEVFRLDDILREMEAKHAKAVEEAKAKAVKRLKELARIEAGKGAIANARDLWTEVVKIDLNDAEAKKFFTAINRLDIIEREKARIEESKQRNESGSVNVPLRRVEWIGENGQLFRRVSEKDWTMETVDQDGKKQEERLQLNEVTPYYIELSLEGPNFKSFRRLYHGHVTRRFISDERWTIDTTGHWKD